MEKYLKMSDVFYAAVEPKQLSGWKHQGRYVELKIIQEAAAHAINSHDELVEMNKELLAALESIENDDGKIPDFMWNMIKSAIAKAKASS